MKSKLKQINYLRGIAIIGVIGIHVTASVMLNSSGNLFYTDLFINQLSRFSVPLFIFISGLVLTWNYKDINDINYYGFIKIRLNSIIFPYVFWSIIYTIIHYMYESKIETFELSIIFKKCFENIFLGLHGVIYIMLF